MNQPLPQIRTVMVALLMPLFASLMSISSVTVALPSIETGLNASSTDLQWVMAGYALAFGVGLVPAGRAGDLWGRRLVFILGVIAFGITSLIAAFSVDPLMLNVMRVAMGIGSALLVPQIIGMIQDLFVGEARGRAYGLMSTVIGLAVALGPLIAGGLIDWADSPDSWRLVFLVNVPVVALGLFFVIRWLPKPEKENNDAEQPLSAQRSLSSIISGLDPIGVVLLAVGIVAIMLPFIQVQGYLALVMGSLGVLLLVAWVLWERYLGRSRPGAPMVDMELFTLPSFTWNSVVLVIYFTGMPALWSIVAIYVQQGLGLGALLAGVVTLPAALMVVLLASSVGRRVEARGRTMLVMGTILALASMVAMVIVVWFQEPTAQSLWWVGASLGVNGIAQAMIIPSAQTLSMRDVPETMAGAAGGVSQTAQRIATAMGLALVTGVYFAVTESTTHQQGLTVAGLVLATMMLITVLAALGAARSGGKQLPRATNQSTRITS